MTNSYIKSPLNYTGGKYKILKYIIPNFPNKISTFVDLFAGGLNVGINVNADMIYANDHIDYLIELYCYFRTTPIESLISEIKDTIRRYDLSQSNAEGYNALRTEYNRTKKIMDLFVLTCYSFNHQIRFNNQHLFNTPFGKERSSYNNKIEANLVRFCKALKEKKIILTNHDFSDFDFTTLKRGDLVYCDPPYLISVGSYNDGKRGFKDWSTKEEQELLHLLDSLNRKGVCFALSNVLQHKGLKNELLIKWSENYFTTSIEKSYSNSSYQLKDRNTKTVEVLITNYEVKQPCLITPEI